MAAVRYSMVAVLHTIRLCVDDRLDAGSSVRGGPMSVQLLRHARWHRSGFASCCWSKRVDLPFCLSLSISLAVDTGRSHFDDNTFRVLCRQALMWAPASRGFSCLWPLFGRPSGTGFDESRSAKRPLASTLGECTMGGVPPGKRQNEEKNAWYLGKTRWWEKHVQLLLSSPLQRRSLSQAFDSFTPVPAIRVARLRCSDFYQAGAAIGLIWSGLGGIGAIFLPQKVDKKLLNNVTAHL